MQHSRIQPCSTQPSPPPAAQGFLLNWRNMLNLCCFPGSALGPTGDRGRPSRVQLRTETHGAGPIRLWVPTAKCHFFFFHLCFSWCYFLASAQHLETTICAKGDVATPAACQRPPLRTGRGFSSSLCAQNTCRSEHSGNPRPPHVLFLNPARS